VMIVCSTVAVGADRNTQTFMATVLGYNPVQHSVVEIDDRKIDLDISKNNDLLYVVPGTTNVNISKISFKTYDDGLTVNGLKFKVFGVIAENIDKAVLKDGEDVLAEGRVENGYISFANVGYKLDKNSEGFVTVEIDAGKNLRAGERIRLDIEDSKDVYVMVGGEIFELKNSFPLKGKPLSVVALRKWEPGYTMPKGAVKVKK